MDRTEDIDKYLSNQMPSEERAAFEQELEQNESLRKELDLQQKLGDILEESERLKLKDRVSEIHKKDKQKLTSILLPVAAVLVVALVASYFVIGSQYSDEALLEHYDSEYPDLVTSMGSNDAMIQEAMELYNSKSFDKAAIAFYDLRKKHGEKGLEIYEVVSLRKSGQLNAAISLSEQMKNFKTDQPAAFEWEKILCYLEQGNEKKTTLLLKEYLDYGYSFKKAEAQQLLDDLNSIWR